MYVSAQGFRLEETGIASVKVIAEMGQAPHPACVGVTSAPGSCTPILVLCIFQCTFLCTFSFAFLVTFLYTSYLHASAEVLASAQELLVIVVAPLSLAYFWRLAQVAYHHLMHVWRLSVLCTCICNALNNALCAGALITTPATGTAAHQKLRQGRGSRQGQDRIQGQWWGLGQGHSQQLALRRGQGRMGPEGGGHHRTAPEKKGWGRLPELRLDRRPEWALQQTEEPLEAQRLGESLQKTFLAC